MNTITLEQLASATAGHPSGTDPVLPGQPLGPFVSDSRLIRGGEVFWALNGPSRDGADFAHDAWRRGAAGVVTQRKLEPALDGRWSLLVEDSQQALWNAARDWRSRLSARVVAITGSVGKTTTRELIRTVLGRSLRGAASPRNYNNHIGTPLSLLSVPSDAEFAVLEIAASARGEIASLSRLCRPDIGVVTAVGDAHLGSFGSKEAIAAAKAELVEELPIGGWAVLNGDEPLLRRLVTSCRATTIWVGRSGDCDLCATDVSWRHGRLSMRVDSCLIQVPVWGRHHVVPILAAVAVGRLFGLSMQSIATNLSEFQPAPMRCQLRRLHGVDVINDAYNASPQAMQAALELLRDYETRGRRIVVCGEMCDLGAGSSQLHHHVGCQVVTRCGADALVTCGPQAKHVLDGALAAGLPSHAGFACMSMSETVKRLGHLADAGDVLLVKGSRAAQMERVVDGLGEMLARRRMTEPFEPSNGRERRPANQLS